jgi:hypothetical protein
MRVRQRVAAVVVATAAAVGLGAGAAQALPGGPWASSSSPLAVSFAGWKPAGYSYGTWQGYREDQGRGSRIQDWSASRAVSGYNGGDRGAYTKHSWYWDGSFCYVASFSDAGGSIGCSSGWHADGSNNSGSNASSTWKYWETWKGVSPEGNSGRGKMQTCWNVVSAPDTCSGPYFLRGSKYDN